MKLSCRASIRAGNRAIILAVRAELAIVEIPDVCTKAAESRPPPVGNPQGRFTSNETLVIHQISQLRPYSGWAGCIASRFARRITCAAGRALLSYFY